LGVDRGGHGNGWQDSMSKKDFNKLELDYDHGSISISSSYIIIRVYNVTTGDNNGSDIVQVAVH
jgi:hypothetical protein